MARRPLTPWHIRRPDLLLEIQRQIRDYCPTLHVLVDDRVVRARGTFPIVADGEELDRFLSEVSFPDDYPEEVPTVREVDRRLPKTPERHFQDNGDACLFVPDERE